MPQIIPPPIIREVGTDFLLNLEDEGEKLSNCCGSNILMPDENGHGMCADCKEHCVPEEEVCSECGETPETGACYFCKQD